MLSKAIELLVREIERMRELSVLMHKQGLVDRGRYRRQEADRLQDIVDLLEVETDES